jgi:hypothetical protein
MDMRQGIPDHGFRVGWRRMAEAEYVEIHFPDEECKHHAATENQFFQPMTGEIRWDFDGNHDVVGLE